jgi:hypothetical protein
VHRLQRWCATGKLACEREGKEWRLPLSQLLRVATLVAEREQSIMAGRPAAAILPIRGSTADLGDEIARRLGLPASTVVMSSLALDGREYLMAVWRVSDRQPADLEPLIEFVEELGGDVLDGEERPE